MDFLKKAFSRLSNAKDNTDSGLEPVAAAADQPEDQQQLAAWVKNKVQDVRQSASRVAHEGVWMTNYAYLLGFDSIYYDTSTRQYRVVGRPSNVLRRSRVHVNKILPTVQRRQARLCKNAPRFEVRPDDATQEAKDRARLEQNILESYMEKTGFMRLRLNMMTGLMQCGHYFMAPYWDDQAGELLMSESTKTTESGETITETDSEYEGDLKLELVAPFEIFCDPLATTLEEAQYVVRAKVRKLDYFASHWGERGKAVKEEDAWLLSVQYELRIQSLTGQGPAQTGIQTQMKNAAIELTYYEKRSKKHPMGRMVVIANDIVLHDGELPVGEIPLVKFDDIQIANKFYSEAIVTHLRPIQDQYNRLISKRADWTNKLLAGKYIAPKGSQLIQEAINDSSGEVIMYTPVPGAAPVQAMQVPIIPQYAYTEEDKLNGMFYDIAGEGEISRGILPAAGIPAIGMQLLLEQDETRVSTITEQHEYATALLGSLMLKYLEKFVTNERLLKIADPNTKYMMKKYTGTDLKSKHDVTVIRGSLAPASKSVKRNDIMNLYQTGLLGDPNDANTKSKVLSWLEFGDTSSVWTQQAIDMAQVSKTISMIETGIVPEVFEMDNHVLHIQEKNNYRKSEKFDQLDAEKQAIMLNDIEEHLEWIKKLTAPGFGMTVNPEDEVNMRTEAMASALQPNPTVPPSASEQLQTEGV